MVFCDLILACILYQELNHLRRLRRERLGPREIPWLFSLAGYLFSTLE
jgi:hypothetical protein